MSKTPTTDVKSSPGVAVVSRRNLRRGQASLYDLIVSKLDTGERITLDEAENIWRTKVCRNMLKGVPHSYRFYPAEDGTNNWYGRYDPMSRDEITFTVLNWLTKNIGILVIRGYLKVIPMIELEPARSLK
jgi:hypothetical protein